MSREGVILDALAEHPRTCGSATIFNPSNQLATTMNVFSYQPNDHSGIDGLLEMIDRNCRHLMKAGGGAISKSRDRSTMTFLTAAQKARVHELASTGLYAPSTIARMVKGSVPAVTAMVRNAGYRVPDGRLAAYRKAMATVTT